MCLNPKWIYKNGKYKQTNYRGQVGEYYEIGTYAKCGSCEACINEKSNNWVIRNFYEEKKHEEKCFITLTYATSSGILVKKDLQDFIKRFRMHLKRKEGGKKIRYFYCGEYGEEKGRPHYHVIIYGWTDKNAKYLGLSGKKQTIYRSETIERIWGLGRTSYQNFSEREAPYIALYNTPQETFKKAYKLSRSKVKQLREYARNAVKMPKNQRNNLYTELNTAIAEMDEKKANYTLIKEFNGWSLALGWEKFEETYINAPIYTFTEYIKDKEFITPTPWVKKLANQGYASAIEEMYRREEETETAANEAEAASKSKIAKEKRRKKDVLEHAEKTLKDEINSNL